MSELPLVLAGPLLRRVDPRNVCVWIALSEPGEVEVTVFAGRQTSTGPGTSTGPALGSQQRDTRKFGDTLRVVVVEVEVVGLVAGSRFSYDVVVKTASRTDGLKGLNLLADGTGTPKPLALGYATDMLPSFVTAAADVKDLRLAHASCRKSNGGGRTPWPGWTTASKKGCPISTWLRSGCSSARRHGAGRAPARRAAAGRPRVRWRPIGCGSPRRRFPAKASY